MILNNSFTESLDPDENHYLECYNYEPNSNSPYMTTSDFNSKISNKNSGLTLLNYNIRSFNCNYSNFISIFDNLNATPEILIFTETWFNSSSITEIQYFNSYHTTRTSQRGGGVSIYVKEWLSSKIISHLSFCSSNIEVCTVKIEINSFSFYIIALYRPHLDPLELFIDNLCDILNDNELRNKNIIVTGDLNVNILNNSPQANLLLNTLQAFYMLPLITQPTRFSHDSNVPPSLLDQIWTNKPIICTESGIILFDLTDHLPTFSHIPISTQRKFSEKVKISFRAVTNETKLNFENALLDHDWTTLDSLEPNISIQFFIDQLNLLYRQNFPLKTKFITTKRALNPWLTGSIKKLIDYKSQYFNLLKLGLITQNDNKTFKNKVNSIIKKAKLSYFKNKFNSCRSNLQKTWTIINNIISPNRNRSNIIKILIGNSLVSDPSDLAELFNTHFANTATYLRSNMPISQIDPISLIPNSSHNFFLNPVSPTECCKIVQTLNNTKSSLDDLSIKLFKLNFTSIVFVLCKLINRCFAKGEFPECLKSATIVPIFKKGDPHSIQNYRPISTLPYIAKIFEKCLYSRLLNYFTNHQLISNHQFGFLPGKSTTDALSSFMEFQYKALNSKAFSLNIFIDLAKAFDTIDHSILLSKLQRYGIRGLPLKLIQSYIRNRKYKVKLGNSYSTETISNIGTAQGSVLASLFFIIYINDLPLYLKNSFPILYADDTTLCFKNTSLDAALSSCNSELEKFYNWCTANKLTINLDKTCFMLITNKNAPDLTQVLKINSTYLKRVDAHKFLGVIIDSRLTFNPHISEISNKISKSIGIMYKLSQYLPSQTILNLYYALVHSYLMYCNTIWGGTYATHLKPLVTLQKKCLRIIHKTTYRAHTMPLFIESKILKIEDIHTYSLLTFIYKNLDLFSPNIPSHTYQTRNRSLVPTYQRLSICQRSVYFSAVKLWSELPQQLKNTENYDQFKKRIKTHILESYLNA